MSREVLTIGDFWGKAEKILDTNHSLSKNASTFEVIENGRDIKAVSEKLHEIYSRGNGPLYIACLTNWVGGQNTGWAASSKPGSPKTTVFASEELALTLSVQTKESSSFTWFVFDKEITEVSKRDLSEHYLSNKANHEHAMHVLLLDAFLKNSGHFRNNT